MSTHRYPIMMFGVNVKDIGIKPEILGGPNAKFDDLEELVYGEIDDALIGCSTSKEENYIGIHANYPWLTAGLVKEPITSSFAAAGYIAKRLAPFCEKSEIEIRRTCDYIRTTGKI